MENQPDIAGIMLFWSNRHQPHHSWLQEEKLIELSHIHHLITGLNMWQKWRIDIHQPKHASPNKWSKRGWQQWQIAPGMTGKRLRTQRTDIDMMKETCRWWRRGLGLDHCYSSSSQWGFQFSNIVNMDGSKIKLWDKAFARRLHQLQGF